MEPYTTKLTLATTASTMIMAGAFFTSSALADDGRILEEITVTAQKREQSLQDVPLSVATMGGEKLDVLKSGGADIKFLSARVPSLYVETSFGRTFPRFYIRGLGNSDFDLNASQPVSLIYDEVVLENPILKGAPIFDLDRVEVLRGPQGTLFGRNTIAGIIKLESKKPTQETEGYARASYGRFNAVEFEGAVGGALADTVSVRVSGLYRRQDGYVDNTFTNVENELEGFKEFAGRLQLLFTPSDQTDILLNAHIYSMDGTATVFRANIIESGTENFVPGFNRFKAGLDGQNEQELDTYGFSARLTHDFGSVTLTSVSGYEHGKVFSRGDIDGGSPAGPAPIPFQVESAGEVPNLKQFTQEIRVASNDWEEINFQVGAFYFDEKLDINNIAYFGGAVGVLATQHQDTRAFALFGNVDFEVAEDLNVIVGLRYSDDKKDFVAARPVAAVVLAPQTRNTKADVLSWDVSGTYRVDDDMNIYARVAKSFRAPSIQGRISFGDNLSVASTENIYSVETGFKADVLDKRGRINMTAFYFWVDNQQLTAVGGASNTTALINADKTVGFGFEVDMEFLLTENLNTTLGISYNDTEIKDDALFITPGSAAGITVLDPVNPANTDTVSLNGNPLPNAPRWVLNWTARYAVPVEGGEIFAYTDWAFRSRINFTLYESVEYTDKNLLEGGLRAGYVNIDSDYEMAVYVRNITNNLSRVGGIDFSNLTGFVNEPRRWGIEFKKNF